MTEAERYKCVIKILEKDVKTAREDGAKLFAHYLVDNANGGVVHISDLPDLVVDFNGGNDERS